MFTEVISPGAVSTGKSSAGGGGRCSGAHDDFSSILGGIYTPALSSAPVSLKAEQGLSHGIRGPGPSDLEGSGEPEEDSWSEEAAGRPLSERLQQAMQELFGDDFPSTGLLAQWDELPLPMKEQLLSILAGTGLPEASQPEAGKFLRNLVQGAGGSTGKAADIEGIFGIYPGDAVDGGPGAAEELRALLFNVTEEQILPGGDAFSRGSELKENAFFPYMPGKSQPEEKVTLKDGVFLKDFIQGTGDTAKEADLAGASGVYPGDSAEQDSGAMKRLFTGFRQEAAAIVKTPPSGEAIPEEGLEGRPRESGGLFSDEGAQKGNSLASTLYVEGAPGEGMGNACSSFVPSQPSGMLQENFSDTMEQIFQRLDYLVRQGGQELRLKLQPEFLGEVLIRMRRMRGVLSAEIITSHPAVKEMIEGQLDMLHRRFQQMNLDVERFDVLLKDGDQSNFAFEREPRREETLHHPGMDYRLPDGEGAKAPASGYYDGNRRVDYLV